MLLRKEWRLVQQESREEGLGEGRGKEKKITFGLAPCPVATQLVWYLCPIVHKSYSIIQHEARCCPASLSYPKAEAVCCLVRTACTVL